MPRVVKVVRNANVSAPRRRSTSRRPPSRTTRVVDTAVATAAAMPAARAETAATAGVATIHAVTAVVVLLSTLRSTRRMCRSR